MSDDVRKRIKRYEKARSKRVKAFSERCNPTPLYDKNWFVACYFSFIAIFILFIAVTIIKVSGTAASNSWAKWKDNAPQREVAREEARNRRESRKAMAAYNKIRLSNQAPSKPKTVRMVKDKRMARPGHPTLGEYLAVNPRKEKIDWELEHGDLMFNADGSLVDSNPGNDYTAEQEYWILALALYAVFVVWAGIGTRSHPILPFLAAIIGGIWAIVVWNF